MNSLPTVARSALSSATQAQGFVHRHPRALAAAVVTALLGTAVTAFGVAPLTTTDVLPDIHEVTVAVEPAGLGVQLELLADHALQLSRSDVTRSGDTADALLARLGIHDAAAAAFIRNDATARRIFEGRVRKQVRAQSEADAIGRQNLQHLVVRGPVAEASAEDRVFERLTIERTATGFTARREVVPYQATRRSASGQVRSTLFEAADTAGLPDGVTMQVAELFGNDIDFRQDLRRGDVFSVVYENLTADGEPVTWSEGAGRVLAARFVNKGQAHEALWFADGNGSRGQYFDFNGRSKAHIFLASPLAFSRVTSGFAMRFHPLLKSWRQHAGVDYAAPQGTPVRSIGDGTVVFAGRQGGYGNVVHVRHGGERVSVYAHLSRIDVAVGERIDQGGTVGAVGATGWATGPHLHFEFRVNGEQVDPMAIARQAEAATIAAAAKPRFDALAGTARAELAGSTGTALALARFE